jgi:D-sedoheptulose 7-phosphate isomerase
MINKQIQAILLASAEVKQDIANDEKLVEIIRKASEVIVRCFQQGGRVYFCGNGGSAADAQHLAAEFSGRFYKERDVLPSEALHANSSYITAVANDYGYDEVYARRPFDIREFGEYCACF